MAIDLSAVQALRDALWGKSTSGFSGATAFIGAGFSRNAEPIGLERRHFPTWAELASRMREQLSPALGEDARANLPSAETSALLRLAEEYCTVFGRSALDAIIREFLPVSRYVPGKVHRRLVSLPWRDILTTNWDTLIETTAARYQPHRYDVVASTRDIPSTQSPRIVKLHGCVVRNQDFTLTEEDFRTYESKKRPFANLVRQSMMENTTCLIGFSGDDPNFLNWSGWRRDMLGTHAPPVFLVDMMDVTQARMRLLDQLKIRYIDLREFVPQNSHESNNEFGNALLCFLEVLERGRPHPASRWLIDTKYSEAPTEIGSAASRIQARLSIPKKPKKEHSFFEEPPAEANESLQSKIEWFKQEVTKTVDIWKWNREQYPGWIVAPSIHREKLLNNMRSWAEVFETAYNIENRDQPQVDETAVSIGSLLSAETGLIEQDEEFCALIARFVYEANWRFEKCLQPTPNWLNHLIWRLLSKRAESPGENLPWLKNRFAFTAMVGNRIDASIATERMFAIALSRLKTLRRRRDFDTGHEGVEDDHGRLSEAMEEVLSDLAPDHKYDLHLEVAQRLIMQGKLRSALSRLQGDTSLNTDPFHLVRRAGLLAEMRVLDQAQEQCYLAIRRIQTQRRLDTADVAMQSRENWATYVFELISSAASKSQQNYRGGRDWNDVSALTNRLHNKSHDSQLNPVRELTGLRVFRLAMLDGAGEDLVEKLNQASPADATISMYEAAGIPFIETATIDLVEAGRLFIHSDGPQAITSLLRCRSGLFVRQDSQDGLISGDKSGNALSDFDRSQISVVGTEFAKQIIRCIENLLQSHNSRGPDFRNFIFERIANNLQILGDIAINMPPETLKFALSMSCKVYSELLEPRPQDVGYALNRFYRKTFEVIKTSNAALCAPVLIEFGISAIELELARDRKSHEWPEPTRFFPSQRLSEMIRRKTIKAPKSSKKAELKEAISNLHEAAATRDALSRNAALYRLNLLCLLKLHNPHTPVPESAELGRTYTELAIDAFGDMKSSRDFNPCRWLGLRRSAQPRTSKAKKAFDDLEARFKREYIHIPPHTRLTHKTLFNVASATTSFDSPPGSDPNLTLTPEDAEHLSKVILNWTEPFVTDERDPPDSVRRELASWIIAESLLPCAPDSIKADLIDRTLDLHSIGFPVDRAFAQIVSISSPDKLAERLAISLRSRDIARCKSAIEGILSWLTLKGANDSSELAPPSWLVAELFSAINGNNLEIAHLAFDCISEWAKLPKRKSLISNRLERLSSLSFYLDRIKKASTEEEIERKFAAAAEMLKEIPAPKTTREKKLLKGIRATIASASQSTRTKKRNRSNPMPN